VAEAARLGVAAQAFGRPQLDIEHADTIARIIAAVRALLQRAAARGEVPESLADFPQIIAAPGLVAIVWNGLFERFEPLDVRKMMKTHLDLLFAQGRLP